MQLLVSHGDAAWKNVTNLEKPKSRYHFKKKFKNHKPALIKARSKSFDHNNSKGYIRHISPIVKKVCHCNWAKR